MTQFADLELLYNQFLKLADEIKDLIDKEDYNEVNAKTKHKDSLIKKLFMMRKTVILSTEEAEKTKAIEEEIKLKEQRNLDYLKGLRAKVGDNLKVTRKKVRINSAYQAQLESKNGSIVDCLE